MPGKSGRERSGTTPVRRRALGFALAVALVAALAGLALGRAVHSDGDRRPPARLVNQATEAQVKAKADEFGITYLHRTRPGGTYWISRWESPRRFSGVDPQDPWFDADHGSGSFAVADGELRISGNAPRMYVHDPQLRRQWRDVEVTVYAMRVADQGIPYAGITAVARSNHLETEEGPSDLCDTRGYGGRLRFDGHADFEKETAHPRNQATRNTEVFPGGMPTGVWIGMKYLVFDKPDGVHLQLWLDRTDGRDGGDWQLVDEVTDNGHVFGDVACAPGIAPEMALTNAPDRAGSESGKPNVSVYFRSDGIAEDGLVYKWASVREIEP